MLYQKKEKITILNVVIGVMSEFLEYEINKQLIKKLLIMALHDKIDDEKAIGKNGLYMAFRGAHC